MSLLRRAARRRTTVWCTLGVVAVVTSACSASGEAVRTDGAYCTEVGDRLADLNTTSFGDAASVERVLASWQAVGESAPLAVQPEWEEVLAAMQLVAVVDPADADAVQTMADTLREAQPAADRLIDYTYRLCGAVIGGVTPVITTPLQVPPTTLYPPPSTTTAVPPSSVAPATTGA
jgi:hypothetical protein